MENWMAFFNQIWCYIFFPMAFLRVKTIGKHHIPNGVPIIYVSNHGSFLDIPLLTYILPGFPAFMGKASLGRIPVFGFMFRNLHVIVERGSKEGRIKALKASRKKLSAGRSLVIFPEGSIHTEIQPGLNEFKDGAFRLAMQEKVPIVPVTICYNWYILPDDGKWLPNFYYCKSIIHPPVFPADTEDKDDEKNLDDLKEKVFSVIAQTLEKENENLLKKIQK
jgi:1-acyl-sn-glycerol-3-phosphate acyltransferase